MLHWNRLVKLIQSLGSFSSNDRIQTWQLKERVRIEYIVNAERICMGCLSCLTQPTHYQIHWMTVSVWLAAVVICGIRGIRNFCLMSLSSWFPRNVGTNRKFAMTKYSTLISCFAFALLSYFTAYQRALSQFPADYNSTFTCWFFAQLSLSSWRLQGEIWTLELVVQW